MWDRRQRKSDVLWKVVMMEKGFEKKKIRAILNFLRNYVLFEQPETYFKFDNVFNQSDKTTSMTWEEYYKMEWEETTAAIVENLLRECDFSDERIASLTNSSVE